MINPENLICFAPELDGMPLVEALPTFSERAGLSEEEAEKVVRAWERWGLVSAVSDQQRVEVEKGTGQYLAYPDQFPDDVLGFVPVWIRDLWARKSMLQAGFELVDELRGELVDPGGEMPAFRSLLPSPFRNGVDRLLALNMFASAVSLMTNLSSSSPAGCVAEEISALSLIERSQRILGLWSVEGLIEAQEAVAASEALGRLFEFFEDADPMEMIRTGKMQVDLRSPNWLFQPFSWVPATGYLTARG